VFCSQSELFELSLTVANTTHIPASWYVGPGIRYQSW